MRQARRPTILLALAPALLGAAAPTAAPPLVRLDISARSDTAPGTTFGEAGAYETLTGIAHMQIDPLSTANRGIVDLAAAPRNRRGLVDYDIDVTILRPRDAARAHRVLIYDVVNRGMKLMPAMMAAGAAAKGPGGGNALLMRHGYTLVWSGWQGDVAGPGLTGARFPVARSGQGPITGRIATEAIFDSLAGSTITLPYPASERDHAAARLTVRALADSPEQAIAATDWHFTDATHVALTRPAQMDAGAIYRFSYVAQDPRVMGLGFAATRDLIAFLRHGTATAGNPLADLAAAPCERDAQGACANPGGGVFSTAVSFGGSQSGRYLRDFLWQGFNRDLAGRRVFDGMIPFIAGARQTYTNFRFAEPGRFSRQHEDHAVPGFTFPFTYATLRDPVTGRSDGILARCTATGTCPRLFHIDTSAEFWQAGASLVGTGGTGHDVAFPANVRAFMIAGGAHAPNFSLPACLLAANPLDYSPVVRALLFDMVEWASGRAAPPPSHWPSLAQGELTALDRLNAPAIPGFTWAHVVNQPIAPSGTHGWPVLVPVVDADGIDRPGIHMPALAAPSGTYLGWNLRKTGYGAGDLCIICGGYVPFPADAGARGTDPRLPLSQRGNAGARRAAMAAAAADLHRQRLLLAEDLAP